MAIADSRSVGPFVVGAERFQFSAEIEVFDVDPLGNEQRLSMSLADRLTDDPWALLDRIDGIQRMFSETFEGWGGKPLGVRAQLVAYVVAYEDEDRLSDAIPVLGYTPGLEDQRTGRARAEADLRAFAADGTLGAPLDPPLYSRE
jgi:hypothetical protein